MKPSDHGTNPPSEQEWEKTLQRVDAPPVMLPTIPCHRPGCEKTGTHMALTPGTSEYTFWCEQDLPRPPVLTPPTDVELPQ